VSNPDDALSDRTLHVFPEEWPAWFKNLSKKWSDDPRPDRTHRVFPEECPELFDSSLNLWLHGHLQNWRRRRAVLVAKGKPEPHEVSPDWQRTRARKLGEVPPTGPQTDLAIVKWHYLWDMVEALQNLALLSRLGAPLTLSVSPVMNEREGREALGDLLDVVADLLRKDLQGKIQHEPEAKPRKKKGRSKLSPRRTDAATLALAAAHLQWKAGTFKTFTKAETAASEAFGLERGGLESRSTRARRENVAAVLREKMQSTIKPENQAAWLSELIKQAVEQDKEADITP
jgi:hypothetical protein